jgi:hypothetical protein
MCLRTCGGNHANTLVFDGGKSDLERVYDTHRQFILDGKNIHNLKIIPFRPKMRAIFSIDQMRIYADAVGNAAYGAFEPILLKKSLLLWSKSFDSLIIVG